MNTNEALAGRSPAARRIGTAARWVLQIVLAAQFAAAGLLKLAGDPQMVAMFGQIGAGQWFRYLVGVLEVAGAAGLLIPRLAGWAALGLAGLMAGAAVTNVAVLHTGPLLPLAYLAAALLVAWLHRARLRHAIDR
ncbi:hypothetical protein Sru01_27190 [Sphaerisporangium rufum]|uniref:DoxX family protein n=1 Tax=Sphaerisporangium rufum TaxID=1381558 RepID=A0A919R5X8_9ACTN|nr:DoxX family protein [Sphaerisporangium rufum]GII77737.1 hypothetical protein Sru01_27190 [Sphaerisporangium rufum]